jgi:hypothetical protein
MRKMDEKMIMMPTSCKKKRARKNPTTEKSDTEKQGRK